MISPKKIIALGILSTPLSLLPSSPGVAAAFERPDLSVLSGFVIGEVIKTEDDGTKSSFKMGGMPLGLTWNQDLSQRWSSAISGQILLDIINRQVIRQGFTGSFAFHLLGGARRIESPGEILQVTASNSYNLSWVVRGGVFNYAASDPNNPSSSLGGGLWEIATGVEYRKDLSSSSAVGSSILTTMATLPASVGRLASRTGELQIFWRRLW